MAAKSFIALALVLSFPLSATWVPSSLLIDRQATAAGQERPANTRQEEYLDVLQRGSSQILRTINLQIVNSAGEPVPDATINLSVADRTTTHRADANGRFQFQVTEFEVFQTVLIAGDPDAEQFGLMHLQGNVQDEISELTIGLSPAKRIDVVVVDKDDKPVEGATVGAKSISRFYTMAKTDSTGRAEILLPSGADLRQVFGWSREYGMDYQRWSETNRNTESGKQAPTEPIQLKLTGFQEAITVNIEDDQGNPVAGATVMPERFEKLGEIDSFSWYGRDGDGLFENVSDENGVVTFDKIPDWHESFLAFNIRKDNCSPDRVEYQPFRNNRNLTATAIEKRLVTGQVTDEMGLPATNLDLKMHGRMFTTSSRLDSATESVSTDENGEFEFFAAPYSVWLPQVMESKRALAGPAVFTITQGEVAKNIQLQLRRPTVLTGQITTGDDHVSVANVDLKIQCSESAILTAPGGRTIPLPGSYEKTVRTNAAGEFQACIGYGNYTISGPSHFEKVKLEITDETVKSITLHHELPANGVLRGKVISGDDLQPVAGAKVNFRYVDESLYEKGDTMVGCQTDADGKFRIERKWGKVMIHVCTEDRSLAAFVEVGAEPELTKVKLVPTQTVTGRLVDRDGNPMSKSFVFVTRWIGSRNLGGNGAETDDEGRFSVNGILPEIEYKLDYTNMGSGGHVMETIAKFTLERGVEKHDIGDVTYGKRIRK